MNNFQQQGKPINPIFQFILIFITSTVIAASLYHASQRFTTNDPVPALERFNPELLSKFGGNQSIVNIGLLIKDFLEFNPIKNEFTVIAVLWFEYDPAFITLDSLDKFSFESAEISEKSKPESRIDKDKIITHYTLKIEFKNQMSYKNFPLDNHRIYLQLVQPYISPSRIIFESSISNFLIEASTAALGWINVDKSVKTGFVQNNLKESTQNEIKNSYPSVLFSIDYLRSGIRYALTILLPLLTMFFISLFAFSVDLLKYPTLGITLATGAVTGLIAYRFVIESLSPAVGYFMLSDYIYFMFLVLVFIVFAFSIIGHKLNSFFKKLIIVCLHLVVILSSIYLMFFWIES